MPIVKSRFNTQGLLANPHLQTILGSKYFKPKLVHMQKERIELSDGDFIDIAYIEPPNDNIVAIFHGLAGSEESTYIQGLMPALCQQGFQPVLMHWRGCSGEPNRLRKSYHSGASDDIAWFIHYLRDRFKPTALFTVGYSLGGNALLKYLGEQGSQSGVDAAVAVCPPLVLHVGANKLNRGFSRVYQAYLLGLLRNQHERKRLIHPELKLPPASSHLNTFWRFDNELTAPLHGFADVHDYYQRCSARPFLPNIETRTHILCAADDPFFTSEVLPDENELSSVTTLEISDHGGHVGFISQNKRWLDPHVTRLLSDFRNSLPDHAIKRSHQD